MVVGGPTIKLSNDVEMPLVGLGTWLSPSAEVGAAIQWALSTGYRLIDTATTYQNERAIGDVLQRFLKSGKIKREDLFITTKLWCTHNRPKDVEGCLLQSLKDLQLDYVDLYLVHMPGCFNHDMTKFDTSVTALDTWKGMEGVYNKRLTRAIGVSNFSGEQIERIMKTASVKIHNCQVECHLYFQQFELNEICKKHGIVLTAYAPLGSPGRTSFKPPLEGSAVEWSPAPDPLKDEVVLKLASKYHKTAAQILLRYLLQRNIAIIPKSVHESRIKENWDIFDFSIADNEMNELYETGKKHQQRLFLQDFLKGHPEDPFKDDRK